MNPRAIIHTLTICFAIVIVSSAQSQTYPFKEYSTGSGLAHSAVRVVLQDSRGFMWFGTDGGLNRYDGNEFVAYLSKGKEKSPIHALHEEPDHDLLIGTYGNGLAKIQVGDTTVVRKLERSFTPPGTYVTAFHEDRWGNLWIGTDGGLMVRFPNGTSRIYDAELGKSIGEIYGIVRDDNGTLWVASHSGLLRISVDATWEITSNLVVNNPARSVLLRKNGDLIVGTSGRGDDRFGFVCRVQGNKLDTIVSYRTAGKLIKAQALFEDANGAIWIGTEYGIYIVGNTSVRHIGTRNGLKNENVYCITQDREGTMWFGTEGGVIKLSHPWILSYGMRDGLSSHAALSVLEDSHGDVWVGMYHGLTKISPNGSVSSWNESSGLLHHTVRSIGEDSEGRLWLSTPLGVNIMEHKRILRSPVPELDGKIDAWGFCVDPRGGMWLGLRGKLVKVKGNNVVLSLDSTNGLTSDVAQPLCVDHSGRVWFTNGDLGLVSYAEGKIRSMTNQGGLPYDRVHCVFQDSRGRIWIGTESGVVQWSDSIEQSTLFEESTFATVAVYIIMEDSSGHIWFGTDHGAFEYTGTSLQQYTVAEGLSSDIIQAGIVSQQGEVWLGTHGGISRFEKQREAYTVPVPLVYFKNVLAGDMSQSISEGGTVKYDDRSLVFLFNSLSYVNEGDLQFQWMLQGLDAGWLPPQKQRQVRYTNVSPGKYIFNVRAANKNGAWSQLASFSFTVLPPFWQNWWFILLCLVVATSALYAVYRYRLGQMLKVERMRTRIAADLHDDIASSLSSVALYSDVIQRDLTNAPDHIRATLSRIRDLSREVMESIGLIVWAVDPRRDELTQVFQYFQQYATQLCSAAGVSFLSNLPNDMKSVRLTPDQRRTIFLILKEALNNTLRHSGCSRVTYNCNMNNNMLEMMLRDDGKGFTSGEQQDGHGLQNMRNRASAIGANVQIESSSGEGTTISLCLRMT